MPPTEDSQPKPGEVFLVLDGANVTPETIPTDDALRVLSVYLKLFRHAAASRGIDLPLTGLLVRPGSALLGAAAGHDRADDVEETAIAADEAAMTSTEFRKAAKGLTSGGIGIARRTSRSTAKLVLLPALRIRTSCVTSFRATPHRVGGVNPTARFTSRSEPGAFTLGVTPELARELGAGLYKQFDIHARVVRNERRIITHGELLDATPVDDGDSHDAFVAWIARAGAHWAEAVDPIEALGRKRERGSDDRGD